MVLFFFAKFLEFDHLKLRIAMSNIIVVPGALSTHMIYMIMLHCCISLLIGFLIGHMTVERTNQNEVR